MARTLRPRSLHFRIRATRPEVGEALQAVSRETPFYVFGRPRPFVGLVADPAFHCTLYTPDVGTWIDLGYGGVFVPVVSGRLREDPGGTTFLRADLRPAPAGVVVIRIWFAVVAVSIAAAALAFATGHGVLPLLLVSGFGLFSAALFFEMYRRYPARAEEAIARLTKALSGFEVERLPEEGCAGADADLLRPPG